ncbi:MAG: hypothetical protein JO197_11955 [Acidobacteria bacterium]|nr:hypothetical protein [Acidobacteriota bacterium]MBV9476191.1 hypothetical protein [Acidobacteriota bacterium]
MTFRRVVLVAAALAVFSLTSPAEAQPIVQGPVVVNYPDAPFAAQLVGTQMGPDSMTVALDVESETVVTQPAVRFRIFAADGSCKGARTFARRGQLTDGSVDTWTITLNDVAASDLVVIVPYERRTSVDEFSQRPDIYNRVAKLFKNQALRMDDWQCRSECLHFAQECFAYCGSLTPVHGYCTSCSSPGFECGDEMVCECIPNGGSCSL